MHMSKLPRMRRTDQSGSHEAHEGQVALEVYLTCAGPLISRAAGPYDMQLVAMHDKGLQAMEVVKDGDAQNAHNDLLNQNAQTDQGRRNARSVSDQLRLQAQLDEEFALPITASRDSRWYYTAGHLIAGM